MTQAVLLMAYGTAQGADDVLRYYTHIRHGRPPSPEQLSDLAARYQAIGGISPLAAITEKQARALEIALNARHGPGAFRVFMGMKHSPPFIADAVHAMADAGIAQAVGLVLAPHYSSMSVGAYIAEAESAIEKLGQPFEFRPIRSWAANPWLIGLLHQRINEAGRLFTSEEQKNLPIIFSAHSLPERILQNNDPYPEELRHTGDLVAQSMGTTNYTFSWQSAGRTQDKWLEPDILDKLSAMSSEGLRQAIICPCGFVSDHLEVLYDLDIEAKAHARQLGMHIERTRSFNDDPDFIDMLASLVEEAAQ